MKNLSHNISLFTIGIIFLALIGMYTYGIIKISGFGTATAALEMEVQNKTAELSTLDQTDIKTKLDDEKNDLSKLSSFFITEGQEFTLIQKVESLCKEVGVACTIQPVGIESEDNLPENFQSLHIIITATGTFKSLYELTSILENLPYRMIISGVNLQLNGDETSTEREWKEVFDFNVIVLQSSL